MTTPPTRSDALLSLRELVAALDGQAPASVVEAELRQARSVLAAAGGDYALPAEPPDVTVIDLAKALTLGHAEMHGNGRLVESAPDLLAALDGLLDGLDANRTGECEGLSQGEWDRRVAAARSALARAEGRV